MSLAVNNKLILIAIAHLFIFASACSHISKDQASTQLAEEILHKDVYLAIKERRIKELTDSLGLCYGRLGAEQEYQMCDKIYNEYILFHADSAYLYSIRLKEVAARINTPECLLDSRTKYCQALYNAGYYKEALDSLPASLPDTLSVPAIVLANYYNLYGRTYQIMSGLMAINSYSARYHAMGDDMFNKALLYTRDSVDVYILKARMAPRKSKTDLIKHAISLLDSPYDDRAAVLYSMLGKNVYVLGDKEASLKYNAMAAIVNIRNATRDALPLINMANVLSTENTRELELASTYLSIALKDVSEYGAHQRIREINSILPVIEAERLNIVKKNKYILTVLVVVAITLLLVIVIAFIISIRQSRILNEAKKRLQDSNKELLESNTIKDEYLGHYLAENSELTGIISRMVKIIRRKIKQKDYADIPAFLDEAWDGNENLHEKFDQIFLKIFPTFVDEFNALVEDAAKIELTKPNVLTPTLRIFALIRLGITDSATISKVLSCSLNTVYNYRTRIKHRAIVDKDDFEKNIKKISS